MTYKNSIMLLFAVMSNIITGSAVVQYEKSEKKLIDKIFYFSIFIFLILTSFILYLGAMLYED